MPASSSISLRLAILFLLLVCSAAMWLYWDRVPGALHAVNIRTGLPQAKPLTDLYPRWYGSRELWLRHRDPYGIEVSREIQTAYYGRALNPALSSDQLDQERFVYPLYVVFLMLPTVQMEFSTVRIVAWSFLAFTAVAGIWLWLRFLRLQLSLTSTVAVYGLALSSIPTLQGLSLLQLGLLVAALIAGAAACTVRGHLFLAGALLAMATIKPQMALLPFAWFALWTLGAWSLRKSLLLGFGTTLAVLIVASELMLPGWLIRYPKSLAAYSNYTNAKSLLGGVLPLPMYWTVSMIVLLGVAWLAWRVRREPAESVWFALVLALALTLTVTIVPTVNAAFNQILLLPAVLLGMQHRRKIAQGGGARRLALYAIMACVFLPWLLAMGVVLVRPNPRSPWYLGLWSAPMLCSFALPVAVFGWLILLYAAVAQNPTGILPEGIVPRRTP